MVSGAGVAGQRPSLGVGVVGWGGIARVHVLALKSLPVLFPALPFDARLAHLATRRPERNAAEAEGTGFQRIAADVSELVADPAVDVVDICTPNALHPDQAATAWRGGKGVYVEKPLAESLASARRLVAAWPGAAAGADAAAAAGTRVGAGGAHPDQAAFVMRFLPAVARAKDLIDAGAIGEVLAFRGSMIHGGYLNPQRPMSWRLDRGLAGGGALADLGVHIIDLVHFLLGEIAEVAARTRTHVAERPVAPGLTETAAVTVDDWSEARCTLVSGAVGTIEASRIGDGLEGTALEIFGREGSIRISGDSPEFPRWFDRRSGELHTATRTADGPVTQSALSVWPPAKLSLGWFVNAHAASLLWFLRNVYAARTGGVAAASVDAALSGEAWALNQRLTPGIPSSLRAQAVLEAAYRSALSEGSAAVPVSGE